MNISLSLDNVTIAEASLIFSGLANGLVKDRITTAPTGKDLKIMLGKNGEILPTDEEIEKAVEAVTPVNEGKKSKKNTPASAPQPAREPGAMADLDEETVTKSTLQEKAQKLVKADKGNKAKIVALLKKAGTDSITALSLDKYAAFNTGLDKLAKPKEEAEDITDDLPF